MIARLCEENGLTLVDVADRAFRRQGSRWKTNDDFWERLAGAFVEIPERGDHSFAEAARGGSSAATARSLRPSRPRA